MTQNDIVQKLWNLCDVLRDDGINYSDYVTELVLLLFVKMEYEQVQNNPNFEHKLPAGSRWPDLNGKSGLNLLNHYRQMLLDLGKSSDPMIAAIYADAQTRLKEPRHLETLVTALDGLDWFSARQDGLGDLYEGLLQKNANETKSGAGQYFTPRALIDSIIHCIKPQLGDVIQDPAAGTAGFLIAADAYIKAQHDALYGPDVTAKKRSFQREKAFVGMELVPGTRRLALMNCLLHGMHGEGAGPIRLGNSLGTAGRDLPPANIILSNPPFGTAKGGGGPTRDDLTYKTSNKQLAFLQHIYRGLTPGGRAAVVLPDNVLFEAGLGTEIRRDLMDKCTLHTLLRLPTGIFYAQGVKTNVLFFQKGTAANPRQDTGCTQATWVYDLRSNMPNFGKRTPFGPTHLKPFEQAYGSDPNGASPRTDAGEQGRFRCFTRAQIAERGDSLDISWLKDADSVDADSLPAPEVLAAEAMAELSEALRELDALMQALGAGDEALEQKRLLAEVMGLEVTSGEVDGE
ncbi:N-6 DNA methylase [Xanthomonas oryzae pv. oryzae]|uniref:class I SAM-dependent DNA methyltransferase n=1 Tax=Xanthomonas oryzae TaxID=347 RepID=UPI000859740C|nr:N-6 DNA methylase [Xanthomonas oryzae]AOS28448.1 SAM-dependent methyltransferase [Xanthomonas oryzae pv. oryzae]AXM10700.1 SAM-dependent methyltransferase [Xanthomonas oryzae pv. oryzae]OLH72771.1 SAM-dependent methyltransferase [Xanthomonas oryzae pv. oryzae]OLI17871.1 SAM-dependent methyltransferase [Xanthomonas oryzae pv. oryzae]RBD13523.1 SAM-dependent methyltransferase [Xanthomonas oryzae pv. oryzae]